MTNFWLSWQGICAMLLIAALLFFLITEHTAHFFGIAPYAIFLLCPLLHLLMHRGHDKKIDSAIEKSRQGGHH